MAMGTERSKVLHNFTMPCDLRWGNQRFLRCMKVNSNAHISPLRRSDHHHPIQERRATRETDKDSSLDFLHESPKLGPTPSHSRRGVAVNEGDGDDGIAATRLKVMLDLQTAADKMKDAIFKDGLDEGEVSAAAADAEGESYRPWNLRTRRASCTTAASGFVSGKNGGSPATDAGGGNGAVGGRVDAARPNSGSSQMHRSDGNVMAAARREKRERAKLSVPLSKRDIEEDFNAMVGHRPPRRPKKRPRIVQKQLDELFPGLWLTEVTPDMYKVIEADP